MEDKQKNAAGKPVKIKCVKKMKDIMTNYYIEAKTARETGKKVAWITSGGPVEPLIAMDIIPVYPENHGAMIGATKMGGDLCEKAENMGYSTDICSYARADIACSRINGGPIGGLPEPDMLVCCNNICGTVLKWYEAQARYFKVPLFILDTPFCHTKISKQAIKYVKKQIYEYLDFISEQCKKEFDHDRFKQIGNLSIEGQKIWKKVLDSATHKPSPMSSLDAFFHLSLIVTLRGTQTVVDYYKELLEEMKDRINKGISAVPNEKIRLLWDNLPIWFKTKWMYLTFAKQNACLVADTYTSAWCRSLDYLDENDFLNTMAIGYTLVYVNIGTDQMAEFIIKMINKYSAKGIVMHSNRSCKPYSLGQYDIERIVLEKTGIPSLIIEADMIDERNFSESQTLNRIEAFLETL